MRLVAMMLVAMCGGCALATPENVAFTENAEYQAVVDGIWEKAYGGKAPVVVFAYVDASTSGITFAPDEARYLTVYNRAVAAAYKADPKRFRNPDGSWKCIMGLNVAPVHILPATAAHEVVHVRLYGKTPGLRYEPTGILVWDFLGKTTIGQLENLRAHGPEFQAEAILVTVRTGIPIQPI
jgi:hypothetical protein